LRRPVGRCKCSHTSDHRDVHQPNNTCQMSRVKIFAAIAGLGLLTIPLLRHVGFERRLEGAKSVIEFMVTLLGVTSGLTMGFVGLMILGLLVDGGSGYRKPALLISMALLGCLWIVYYPSGWLLGVPLTLYPLLRRFGARTEKMQKEEP
jgi:hypothetical protein